MTITLTLEGVLLTMLAVAGTILLIYLTVLVKNMIGTLKKVDALLVDAKVVTTIAADKAQKVDGLIDGVGESVGIVVDAVKGNQSAVAAATNFVNATSSLLGMFKRPQKNKVNAKESN